MENNRARDLYSVVYSIFKGNDFVWDNKDSLISKMKEIISEKNLPYGDEDINAELDNFYSVGIIAQYQGLLYFKYRE